MNGTLVVFQVSVIKRLNDGALEYGQVLLTSSNFADLSKSIANAANFTSGMLLEVVVTNDLSEGWVDIHRTKNMLVGLEKANKLIVLERGNSAPGTIDKWESWVIMII